jgi:RNA polymerase sigma factor (sigma-70 family)
MRPVELENLKGVRRSEYERTREMHIRENMWKASHAARKVSGFSGLPFEELRSVALEAMVKLYDKWDPEKANFSTWLNRSLTFQLLNYLRDSSRMIKVPRTYADTYIKIRKIIGANPEIPDHEVAEMTGLKESLIRETRGAYQVTYQEINEDTEVPFEDENPREDSIDRMLSEYSDILMKLADLPEKEYQFLNDVYVNKRANSTIFRNYPGINSQHHIKEETQRILSKVLEVPCLSDM